MALWRRFGFWAVADAPRTGFSSIACETVPVVSLPAVSSKIYIRGYGCEPSGLVWIGQFFLRWREASLISQRNQSRVSLLNEHLVGRFMAATRAFLHYQLLITCTNGDV